VDKFLFIAMLYDFYSELLTEKQKSVIELYYFNDFSLNEVAEEYGITKQAVQDMLKRTEKLLMYYESKLLLVYRYLKQKQKLKDIIKKIDNTINDNNLYYINDFKDIKNTITNILD